MPSARAPIGPPSRFGGVPRFVTFMRLRSWILVASWRCSGNPGNHPRKDAFGFSHVCVTFEFKSR
eukprot:7169939-Lingulodinium_polyedra.AAC.1